MYICGIDGGGTKTKIVIADLNGKVIDSIIVGPSSIDIVTFEDSVKKISDGIKSLMVKNNLLGKIESIFAGLGGISSEEDINKINSLLKNNEFMSKDAIINSANDVENAWYSGCNGRASITLIVGTGSVAYGVDELGNTWRSGGINFLEGDYGSSYDLAIRSLRYLAKSFDNRIETSMFMEHLKKEFNIQSFKDLVSVFEEYVPKRTELASYSKLVTEWAIKGDRIALKIVDEGVVELVNMVKAVDKTINLRNKEISIIGSLGNFDSPYRTELHKKIKDYNEKFIIHENDMDPAEGAMKIALHRLKIRSY